MARDVKPAPGVAIAYSGQFEYLQRAEARLLLVVPATLAIILLLLFLTFRRLDEALLMLNDRGQAPLAGAVYAPALGKLWFGGERAYACDAKPGAPLPGSRPST